MRCIGLDFGSKTLGIAISDHTKTIASSYDVLKYNEDYTTMFDTIKKIIEELKVETIVLGLPKNMDNTMGERATKTLEFKKDLKDYLKQEIILEDERVTTKEATRVLIQADMSRKKRKGKVDQVAASFILQSYLDRIKKGN
jgi:putative Holliday junction resolvase